MPISHGSLVVCGDRRQQWYGWIGTVCNENQKYYGIRYPVDPGDPPPATGHWTRKHLVYLPDQLPANNELHQAVDRYARWSTLLTKARESALLAVETFNRPTAQFRTGAYTTLMIIAWTSLLLAVIVRREDDPYEHDETGASIPADGGGFRFLGLRDCAARYFTTPQPAVTSNLELFLRLRNRVEHADALGLDEKVFGEAQALLMNFERILVTEFGRRFALIQGLAFPITFSYLAPEQRAAAMRRAVSSDQKSIFDFVDAYRSSLSDDILDNQDYSFRVFLLPRTGNHRGSADVAMEWIDVASADEETLRQVEHMIGILKVRHVDVTNKDRYKAGYVAMKVREALKVKFSHSNHHPTACRKLGAWKTDGLPQNEHDCDNRYCVYDPTFKACTYTRAWIDRLIKKLADPAVQVEVFGKELIRQ